MLSSRKALSAMLGLAMLALPSTVLAGHRNDRNGYARPNAPHDNGWHKGWFKHQQAPAVRYYSPVARPTWGNRNYTYDTHRNPWWNEEPDGDDYRPAPAWHHEPDADDYHAVCDADGDNCQSAFGGWGGNYDYGPPPSYYDALPPSGYGVSQQLNWLLQRRQAALRNLNRMRARGDSAAAGRMAQVLNNLNARIRRVQGGYAPAANYGMPINPYYGNPAAFSPNYGGAYPISGGYNPYYGNSPTMNLLGSLVGPVLGSLPH